jgi:uncharacterized protein YdhG (YjbR/CyaY superfamily)
VRRAKLYGRLTWVRDSLIWCLLLSSDGTRVAGHVELLKERSRDIVAPAIWAGTMATKDLASVFQGVQPMADKPQTHEDYLAALSDDKRAALEKLRKSIREAAPGAEECISYQPPAFRLDGRMLVAFGATAKHSALYLMSSSTVEAHKEELRDYDTSKGTIRFQADEPLPTALVRTLVMARIAENAG